MIDVARKWWRGGTRRLRLSHIVIITVTSLILCEAALRLWVPLSAIVDPVALYPKVWYLENVDSLQARAEHPTHDSHPTLGWTYAPGVRQQGLSTNSQGIRGQREYDVERRPGWRRGLVLGDSFSAGYGVGDDETFAAVLERLLPQTEVLNLAVPGYGVGQAILRWELMGRRYSPDFIILGIFIPDFHRNVLNQWFDAPKPRFRVVNGALVLPEQELPAIEDTVGNERRLREDLAPLLRTPRIWVAASYVAGRVAGRLRGWREPDATFLEKQQLLELLIARLADDCRQRGIDLVLVTILTGYPDYADEDRILRIVADAAGRAQVPVLNLARFLGATPEEGAEAPVFDPRTDHWSAYAHRRAAASIARFLEAHGVIEPS